MSVTDILSLVERPFMPAPAEVRRILRSRGILVRELAEAIDVHPVTVSKWLAGTQRPTGTRADRYATVLQILLEQEALDAAKGQTAPAGDA